MTNFKHGKRVRLVESDLLRIYDIPMRDGKYRVRIDFDELELLDVVDIHTGLGKFLDSKDALPVAYSALDPDVLEATLRSFISDLDYDLHKSIDEDEETNENRYPEQVEAFLAAYEKAVEKALEDAE